MLRSTPNAPTFLFDRLPLRWRMTRCEKYAFAGLVEAAAPDTAIEIGTDMGGSLQVIASRARKVYSIDISPSCAETLRSSFDNVEFLTGDSKILLPGLLRSLDQRGEFLQFVLIDGDHTAEAVRTDIHNILEYVPSRPLYIVFHDSFHPPSRRGVLEAEWERSPHVQYVEVDFIPGVFHYQEFDTAPRRSMFGGLAVALMTPEKRDGALVVHQSQRGLFEAVLARSRYTPRSPFWWREQWNWAKAGMRRD